MSKQFLSVILITASFFLSAQDSVRVYYDISERVVEPEYANSFCDFIREKDSALYIGSEYYMSGYLKSVGRYTHDDFEFLRIGKFIEYYPNRTKSNEGNYVVNKQAARSFKSGKWKYYYPDGKMKAEWVHKVAEDMFSVDNLLMNFWDSTGVQLATRGNGYYYYTSVLPTADTVQSLTFSGKVVNGRYDSVWAAYYTTGKKYCIEQYKNGKLIKGTSYDIQGNEYNYDSLTVIPLYQNADTGIIKFLVLNVQYPTLERDNDIQGKVLVGFNITRSGAVSNVRILKGVSEGLDKESLRVVKMMTAFAPARYRGQPIEMPYTLPIVFKLE